MMIRNSRSLTIWCIAVVCSSTVASAWIAPTTNLQQSITRTTATVSRQRRGLVSQQHNGRLGDMRLYNKFMDFISPYDTKIPQELRAEIAKAEANTEAAKNRGLRVAIYTTLAILGFSIGFFNGFLTDLRDKDSDIALAMAAASIPDTGNNLFILEETGFGWVLSNPIYSFFFTNKIGGGLAVLLGGASGLLAESEFDTKRLNGEKIYEELERRRDQKLAKMQVEQQRGGTGGSTKSNKKKRRSGKEKKRLAALSEVMMDDVADTTTETEKKSSPPVGMPKIQAKKIASTDSSTKDETTTSKEAEGDNKPGIFDKMKGFYKQADSMAASQALIMNKSLEEAGVVEKITDETGLKVIGREEAKKLEEKEGTDEKK